MKFKTNLSLSLCVYHALILIRFIVSMLMDIKRNEIHLFSKSRPYGFRVCESRKSFVTLNKLSRFQLTIIFLTAEL